MAHKTLLDIAWWNGLTPAWRQAFAEVFFRHTGSPTAEELTNLYHSPALRFAGPGADYPNMSFNLQDAGGLEPLVNLEVLVLTHHSISSLAPLAKLVHLQALFVYNNRLTSLAGVETMTGLKQLFAQNNLIDSLLPIQSLTGLQELYVNTNRLHTLDGLTADHSDLLEKFFCKPNDGLKQRELLRVERELGIRCRSLS